MSRIGNFQVGRGPFGACRDGERRVAGSGFVIAASEVQAGSMPRQLPDIPRYGYRYRIETRAKKPGDMFTGFRIGHIGPIVRLPERALWPWAGYEAKIAVQEGHHRNQRRRPSPVDVDAIWLKPMVKMPAELIGIDSVSHRDHMMQCRFDRKATWNRPAQEIRGKPQIVGLHGLLQA